MCRNLYRIIVICNLASATATANVAMAQDPSDGETRMGGPPIVHGAPPRLDNRGPQDPSDDETRMGGPPETRGPPQAWR